MSHDVFVPCFWFDDQAEEAAAYYARTFPGGRVVATSHYPTSFDNPGGKPRGSVLTVELEVAGQRFTALNGGPHFEMNPTISFFVRFETAAEVDRLYAALREGGADMMALGAYPFSDRYAWVRDRFGVTWQLMAGPLTPTIAPCLMFAGAQHGRAEEALRAYETIFPGARLAQVERYGAGEGAPGTVKHGRLVVGDQELVAMDSHIDHGTAFNEGISLQVMCDDQAELDRSWAALSDGGEQGPCGWLKDRFGVSWQVVPRDISAWMASDDVAARDRAFKAMLGMKKLDVAALRAAFTRA